MESFKFRVIDYHNGDTKNTLIIESLEVLKAFCDDNQYTKVCIDFKNSVLWVTKHNRFTQR